MCGNYQPVRRRLQVQGKWRDKWGPRLKKRSHPERSEGPLVCSLVTLETGWVTIASNVGSLAVYAARDDTAK